MLYRVWDWINERWPIKPLFKLAVEEEVAGGAKFAYTLGSATLVIFLLQALTGVWQMFYYVPTIDHAYSSVSYMQTQVPFGWLAHSLHVWSMPCAVT